MAAPLLTKAGYVSACQYLLLLAFVATVVLAVGGVARLDIVVPRVSAPAGQTGPSGSASPAAR